MAGDNANVKGLSALNDFLQAVPVKVEKNILRGALRAGLKPVQLAAKQNVRSVSGKMAAGLKIGTRVRNGKVTARLVARGPHGFAARMVEFGTRMHRIFAKNARGLFFGGRFAQSVLHPGARPKPFMRPALDSQKTSAVIAAAEYMKKQLATRAGLDTSAVLIEGDE